MLSFLYAVIVLPLESVIESLFYFAFDKFSLFHYGGAIVFVSLAVNLATLPVYNLADSLHERSVAREKALARGVRHIRRTFTGDERFLMLGEYYRQNGYSPFSPLLSSLSILIQIPFFIAAYRFLSSCPDLSGSGWLFIRDLGLPDALVHVGTLPVNLLPVLMTLVNILSGAVYAKDSPVREKIQIYVLALLFLLLLYASPSGLVLYWLLNNLFGLCKNLARKYLRRPIVLICILLDLMAAVAALYTMFIKHHTALPKKLVVYALCLVIFCLPLLLRMLAAYFARRERAFALMERKGFRPLFILSALCLALLAGFALPACMVASSPEDFSFLGSTDSPLPYVGSSLVLMAGLFVFWPSCFYFIAPPNGRACLSVSFFIAAVCAVLNAFVFKSEYGIVSIMGMLDSSKGLRGIHPFLLLAPVVSLVLIVLLFVLLFRIKRVRLLIPAMLVLCLGLCFLGLVRCTHIQGRFRQYARTREEAGIIGAHVAGLDLAAARADHPDGDAADSVTDAAPDGVTVFPLTRTGKNVIVIFLDRAIGPFLPYIMQDYPSLRDSFSGFVYYRETLSFSNHTVKGVPALYGGYEYTPEEMNRRDGQLLKDKHNEAMLALPRLFSESGWRVTVTDPPWMDYNSGSLAPFAPYPDIRAMNVSGLMATRYIREHPDDFLGEGGAVADENARDAIPRFCLMQMLYPPLRKVYYHDGDYYHRGKGNQNFNAFVDSYSSLYYMNDLTAFDDGGDSYVLFANEATHEPILLKDDAAEGFRPVNARFEPSPDMQLSFEWHENDRCFDLRLYEVDCAALLRLGEWFDYLKANGAYDNSRIIIVSDHGDNGVYPLAPGFTPNGAYAGYTPLLLFKDFDSSGNLMTDMEFMTNADVPLLSIGGLDIPAVNPFTGTAFRADKDGGINVYGMNEDTDAEDLRGKTAFDLSLDDAFHVSADIYVESNWIPLAEWKRRKGAAQQ